MTPEDDAAAAGSADNDSSQDQPITLSRQELQSMFDNFKTEIKREAEVELAHFKTEYIRDTMKKFSDQLGPKIGLVFIPIVEEVKEKINAGKFVNFDTIISSYSNKVDEVSHLVFENGLAQENLQPKNVA